MCIYIYIYIDVPTAWSAPGQLEGRVPSARVSGVVCRCFGDSGAERKVVDEPENQKMNKHGTNTDQHRANKGATINLNCSQIKPWNAFFLRYIFVEIVKTVTAHV